MKIALIGYGKMGKAVEAYALNRKHEIVLRINSQDNKNFTTTQLKQCDVAIEFTSPVSAYYNILKCFEADIPVVCGSTGWYEQLDEIKKLCASGNHSFIYSSNFSIGVNLFFEINRQLAAMMNTQNDYDILIEEIHHLQKLDKPSGTALSIAKDILENTDRKKAWKLKNGDAPKTDLVIESKREDEVVGTHIVKYQSSIDEITIEHKAYNRSGFAQGAVHAAEWIISRKGFYEMKDMLNFENK
ncbi:MAG: 4-hydroxy-tetrahydrodipicolinate reductase [Bacteroidia bacterium]